jgi:4-hydroxy-tetrahydrodipicolinate synthase
MARFGEVVTAMVTPFDDAGTVDLDGARDLARWLAAHGSDGLVVTGTTGESPTLTDEEKLDLWRAVSEAVTVPVLAGSGSNDTAHSVELTRKASDTGVAGILAVVPYYNRPPQAGIEAHLRAVAASTHLPVMVYDVPVRTGRGIAREVLVRLAREVSNVAALRTRPAARSARRSSSRRLPPASRSTAATTPSPSSCWPSAPSGSSAWRRTGPERSTPR